MIEAYLDESGTHDQATIVVMAGFLSSSKRWRRFEKQWNTVLNPDGADRVFHATDCLGKDGHGDFKDWPKQRRDALVNALIPIARKRTLASFACAFSVQDYEEVVPEWIRKKWRHPYYVCMFTIVNAIYVNRSRLEYLANEKVAFVFARKPKFGGAINRAVRRAEVWCRWFQRSSWQHADGSPDEDIPIQAADLLCYLVRTFHEKDYFQRDSAHRRTIDLVTRLELKRHLMADFLNREALREFARIYEETHEQVGEWNWNAHQKKRVP